MDKTCKSIVYKDRAKDDATFFVSLSTWSMDVNTFYQDKECQDGNRFVKEEDEFYLNMMTLRYEMYDWRCQVGS